MHTFETYLVIKKEKVHMVIKDLTIGETAQEEDKIVIPRRTSLVLPLWTTSIVLVNR